MAVRKRSTAIMGVWMIVLLAALAAVVSAGGDAPTSTATTVSPSPTPPIPVPANNASVMLRSHSFNPVTGTVSGTILVKNLAYDKKVYAIYSSRNGDWKTGASVEAFFNMSIPHSNYELWTISGTHPSIGNNSQFYLQYTATDFDSNGVFPTMKNYPINPGIGLFHVNIPKDNSNVKLKCTGYNPITGYFTGEAWILGLAYEKKVQAFYSNKNWNFTLGGSLNAQFESSEDYNYEIWKFSGHLRTGAGWGSQFHLRYDATTYDNNGTKNYRIVLPPVIITTTTTTTSTTSKTTTTTSSLITTSIVTSSTSTSHATSTTKTTTTTTEIPTETATTFTLPASTIPPAPTTAVPTDKPTITLTATITHSEPSLSTTTGDDQPTPAPVPNVKMGEATYDAGGVFSGEIKVKNIGDKKAVTIFYSLPNGDFTTQYKISAKDTGVEEGNVQIWRFSDAVVKAGYETQYYVEYVVEDVDTNVDYVITTTSTHQPTVPTSGNIRMKSATLTGSTFSGEIWVKDHAFAKTATVFYSSTTGAITDLGSIAATFETFAENGYQVWRFSGDVKEGGGVGSKFYVRYTVTDYDTNNGRNFLLPYVPPTTVPTVTETITTTAVETTTATTTTTEDTATATATATATSTPTPLSNIKINSVAYDVGGAFSGEITIRNIAFNKVVEVYYSSSSAGTAGTDFSKGYKLGAGYKSGAGVDGFEVWSFDGKLIEAGEGTYYYAAITVDDYDSNSGSNYAITTTPVTIEPTTPTTGNIRVKSYEINNTTLSGELYVKDIAFTKSATVFYSSSAGDFGAGGSIAANYDRTVENGFQVWKFSGSVEVGAGVGSKFYVKYTVKDFDTNNGFNYRLPYIAPTITASATVTETKTSTATATATSTPEPIIPNVKITDAVYEVTQLFYGEIRAKNIAFTKILNIFYSLGSNNDFSAGLYLPASYKSSAADGTEAWTFRGALVQPGAQTRYYAEYVVETIDGNGGSNYPITATPSTPLLPNGNHRVRSYTFSNQTLSGEIWVKDLAFTKEVSVVYSGATGNFDNGGGVIQASYKEDGGNGYQVWKFEGPVVASAGIGSRNYPLAYIAPTVTATSVPTSTTSQRPTATPKPTDIVYGNPNPSPPPATMDAENLINLQSFQYDPPTNLLTGYVWLKVPTPKPVDPLPRATFTIWCTSDVTPWDGTYRPIRQRVRAVPITDLQHAPFAPPPIVTNDPNPIATTPAPTASILLYPFTVRRCGPGFGAVFYATVDGEDEGTIAKVVGREGRDDNGGYFYRLFLPDRRLPAEFGWKGRTVYQILTDRFAPSTDDATKPCNNLRSHCGGTFNGITRNLDYIKELGFDAIWISPVVQTSDQNPNRSPASDDPEGYHGYYAQDLYTINPKFGTADEFKTMIAAARALDIHVMIDVVANHLGIHNATLDQLPAPFNDASRFHKQCQIDYGNQTSVEQCWLDRTLPDLDTENEEVVKALYDWIRWLADEFKFDGLRIDTAKHVRLDFWPDFVKSSGNLFSLGEVLTSDISFNARYESAMGLLNYPSYFRISRGVFGSNRGSMWEIESQLANDRILYKDTSMLGTFLDNHDQPRFADLNGDPSVLKNALTLTLFSDGIPIVYYGTELGIRSPGTGDIDPRNRQAFWDQLTSVWYTPQSASSRSIKGFLQTLLRIRRSVTVGSGGRSFVHSKHESLRTERDFHAFRRGDFVIAVTNGGSSKSGTFVVKSPFGSRVLRDVFSTWKTYTPDANGDVSIVISGGEPVVLIAV
ncbi:hypothetical protein HDU67_010195 [Dinochytrium kinnereticum]|nr:hypothetical protein HDU67_010195 [Dinochytrium kinnereticum]